MKFRFPYMTQTQLGKLFGTTSHKIGQWLKKIGLRDAEGKPTEKAHDGGFCTQAQSGQCGYHWTWHSEKTIAALRKAGYALVANPPQSLVNPAILNGPYSIRQSASAEFAIENADGSVSLWANNSMTAHVVIKILNALHKTGVIDRMCEQQRLLQSVLAPQAVIDSVVTPFE